MKSFFGSFYAVACVVIGWSTLCFSQPPAEKDLHEKLAQGDVKALDKVLKTPDEYSALTLYLSAGVRLEKWTPKAPQGYRPGYEFNERLPEKDAEEAAKQNRTEFLSRMGDLSKLLSDKEYFAAFQVVQAYNLAPDDKRPTDLENEKAMDTMRQIEKDKQLKGFFSEQD